ncbi:MAG: hypothetical protein WCD35_07285 [Mycobacteriales bacterium]
MTLLHDEGQQMTDSTTAVDAPTVESTVKPTGLKAKAGEVGLKVYLKAPQPAQNAMLQGFLKAQPVVAKVSPHGKRILGGGLGVLVLRQLRRRGR